tara:strand:- start:165 stop:1295 length:1131 start_codon:yes stop_codon:yes gene_type:complete
MAITRIGNPALANVREPNFRNIIINGDMSISQRSTSASSITSASYNTVDRWQNYISSLGTWTVSQDTTVPTGQGFAKSLKYDCTTADASPSASDVNILIQKFEGQNLQYLKKGTSSAESLTLSFWVRSNKTGTYTCEIFDGDNTRYIGKTYSISSADTWEKKTITFDGDTTGTLDNDNASSLNVHFWLGAGSDFTGGTFNNGTWGAGGNNTRVSSSQVNLADSTSNEWYVTGVQLEAGSVASEFEFLPVDVNLQRCRRYFYSISGAGHSSPTDGAYNRYVSFSQSSNKGKWFVQFPVSMRTNPTFTADNITSSTVEGYNYNTSGSLTFSSVAADAGGNLTKNVEITYTSGVSVGNVVTWRWNNSPNASFQFSSELS